MLRYLLIITVLFAQLCWSFRPLLPYVEYGLNREYIAKVLCINQDKPVMKCDGKCYLKAQLAQQHRTEEPAQAIVPLAPNWESMLTWDISVQNAPVTVILTPLLVLPFASQMPDSREVAPPTPPPRFIIG